MIKLEFIKSPDFDVLNTFQYFQNEIYIGRTTGDLKIKDPSLHNTHLMIEVVEGELILHPQTDVDFYLLDGKRASSIRKIKKGQIITIGSSQFKILEFEQTPFPSKKKILDQKLAQFIEENSPHLKCIEQLANMMK